VGLGVPPVAVTSVGEPGTVVGAVGVTELEASEGVESPTVLVAVTLNV
jgi:hypothetical protein